MHFMPLIFFSTFIKWLLPQHSGSNNFEMRLTSIYLSLPNSLPAKSSHLWGFPWSIKTLKQMMWKWLDQRVEVSLSSKPIIISVKFHWIVILLFSLGFVGNHSLSHFVFGRKKIFFFRNLVNPYSFLKSHNLYWGKQF